MDIEEYNPLECKEIVRKFLTENKINLNELKKDKKSYKNL